MIDLLKEVMRPSSVTCILILLLPGIVALYVRRLGRFGRLWLSAVFLGYWILSAPGSVLLLARTLTRGYEPIRSADQIRGTQAIVVLGAGMFDIRASDRVLPVISVGSALRTLEAARLYEMAGSPFVIASGGVTSRNRTAPPESETMRQALLELAVPADRIIQESGSKNTRDEAVLVAELLRARGLTRIVLVTSPLHMRRAQAAFVAAGMQPIPAISALTWGSTPRALGLIPTDAGIWLGDGIVYEWAARAYYWWRGWI